MVRLINLLLSVFINRLRNQHARNYLLDQLLMRTVSSNIAQAAIRMIYVLKKDVEKNKPSMCKDISMMLRKKGLISQNS